MKTLTITRYEQLSRQQWLRIIATVKRRVRKITGQDCDIGLGRKIRDRKPCGWQVAIRVYLPRKRKRVSGDQRIPSHFLVRLRRADGRYDCVRLRSDVDCRSEFQPTRFRFDLGGVKSTVGYLIYWTRPGRAPQWGMVTVAHAFDQIRRVAFSIRIDAQTELRCRLLRRSSIRSGVDLAVVEIRGVRDGRPIVDALRQSQLISGSSPSAIDRLSEDQVIDAVARRRAGRIRTIDGDRDFKCEEIFPAGFQLGKRRLVDCVRVIQPAADVFKPGTSGTGWQVGSVAACMQVGGRQPDFREGLGQPLYRLDASIRTLVGTRQMRVIAAF